MQMHGCSLLIVPLSDRCFLLCLFVCLCVCVCTGHQAVLPAELHQTCGAESNSKCDQQQLRGEEEEEEGAETLPEFRRGGEEEERELQGTDTL